MRTHFIDACLNCGKKLPHPPKVFQGVLICEDCFKIVSHYIQRTKNELNMLFLVYTDMLRVALVKGELRPPPAVPAGKETPALEVTKAFQRMAQKIGGTDDGTKERGPNGQGAVHPLPEGEEDPSVAVVRGG